MRSFLWITFIVASAAAAQPARNFNVATYTPPRGFTVVEKQDEAGGRVEMTRATSTSYCIIAIYASTPAGNGLDASFAAEWNFVALKTIAAVPAPQLSLRNLGNTRAAVGRADSTAGGQPASAMFLVLDAGARVLPILVLTPTRQAFGDCEPDVEALLRSLAVHPVSPSNVTQPTNSGKLVVPSPPPAITIRDLAGEWGQNDGVITTYVDSNTGASAGFDAIHITNTWNITPNGAISQDFFAIRNGKKVIEKSAGTVTLAGGVLAIKFSNQQRFVLRGWLDHPTMTIMKLNGPWYDAPIPADIFTNPAQGTNLDQFWVRKK